MKFEKEAITRDYHNHKDNYLMKICKDINYFGKRRNRALSRIYHFIGDFEAIKKFDFGLYENVMKALKNNKKHRLKMQTRAVQKSLKYIHTYRSIVDVSVGKHACET